MFAYIISKNAPFLPELWGASFGRNCNFLNSAQLCVALPTKLHQPVTAIAISELMLYMCYYIAEGLCNVSPLIPSPPNSLATLSAAQVHTSVWDRGQRKRWQKPAHCTQDTPIVGAILCKIHSKKIW